MRRATPWSLAGSCLLVSAAACTRGAPEAPARAASDSDVLVLELGGEAPSLRAALARRIAHRNAAAPGPAHREPVRSMGSDGAPPPTPAVAPAVAPAAVPAGREPRVLAEPGSAAASPPASSPPATSLAAGASTRRATLRTGQTLYRLAREHLGDGNRWREIATLNGWSEDDVARLPANAEVKLPNR